MGLSRRDVLRVSALAGLTAALPACGSGLLEEPDVQAAGFGENAEGTVTMWCRGATQEGSRWWWTGSTPRRTGSGSRSPRCRTAST
jgi:multiple sugar transport system substrate-binding protein